MEAIIFKKEVNKGRLTNIYDSIWKGTIYIRPLESPLDCKEIKPVNTKGNQPWIFIRKTDAEAEAPIIWPLDAKGWLIGKDTDAGKVWRQKKNGVAEDEMVRKHHQFNGHEFEQTLGDGEGQESLVCGSPLGHKETWLSD